MFSLVNSDRYQTQFDSPLIGTWDRVHHAHHVCRPCRPRKHYTPPHSVTFSHVFFCVQQFLCLISKWMLLMISRMQYEWHRQMLTAKDMSIQHSWPKGLMNIIRLIVTHSYSGLNLHVTEIRHIYVTLRLNSDGHKPRQQSRHHDKWEKIRHFCSDFRP